MIYSRFNIDELHLIGITSHHSFCLYIYAELFDIPESLPTYSRMSVSSFLFKQSATLTDNQCYKIPRGFQLCVYQRHIQMSLVDTDAARRHHAIEALSTILALRAGFDDNADYKYLMICYIILAISRVVILCMFTSMQGALDDFVSCPLHHI